MLPPRVEILLSTHNGARWLPPLLESLERQDHGHVAVTIRDDLSRDGTRALIDAFVERTGARRILGANLGATLSFFALIEAADAASDYIAFCDQDDVWLPGKLSRAVARLAPLPPDWPALYCSRLTIVDADLARRDLTPLPRRGPSFANALVENIATGCTIVMNRAARALLMRGWPAFTVAHDWWCYLVLAGLGQVIYDPEPAILYRQHGENAIGAGGSPAARLAGKVRRQLAGGSGDALRRQAAELRRIHGPALSPDHLAVLDAFLGSRSALADRVRFALSGQVHRQAALDDLAFRLLYVLGRA